MKVTVFGVNYTGAHFRDMIDPTDGRDVKMVLEGKESKIATFLLENFSYGQTQPEITSIAEVAWGIKSGNVMLFDGCGGITKVLLEDGKTVVNTYKDFPSADDDGNLLKFSKVKWYDLGTVNVDKLKKSILPEYVNMTLRTAHAEGKLPARAFDDPVKVKAHAQQMIKEMKAAAKKVAKKKAKPKAK